MEFLTAAAPEAPPPLLTFASNTCRHEARELASITRLCLGAAHDTNRKGRAILTFLAISLDVCCRQTRKKGGNTVRAVPRITRPQKDILTFVGLAFPPIFFASGACTTVKDGFLSEPVSPSLEGRLLRGQ